jgi:membrane peptidoglycan carboxypeptidase
LNIPAVAVMQRVGVPSGLDFAAKLGVTTLKDPSNYGLSLVLGTGEVPLVEMTNVYSVFAANGVKHQQSLILEIDDKSGDKIYRHEVTNDQVMSPKTAFLISSILSDNKTRAEDFGNALTISRPAAVKTGTAEDYRDALTIGYTPSLVVGVWVGNNDNSSMDRVAGSLGAAPIWRQLMEKFLLGTPVEKFNVPDGVSAYPICSNNGLLLRSLSATSSATLEYFIRGTEPKRYCDSYAPVSTLPQTSPTTPPSVTQSRDPYTNRA